MYRLDRENDLNRRNITFDSHALRDQIITNSFALTPEEQLLENQRMMRIQQANNGYYGAGLDECDREAAGFMNANKLPKKVLNTNRVIENPIYQQMMDEANIRALQANLQQTDNIKKSISNELRQNLKPEFIPVVSYNNVDINNESENIPIVLSASRLVYADTLKIGKNIPTFISNSYDYQPVHYAE